MHDGLNNSSKILLILIAVLLLVGSNRVRFQCDENVGPCYPYSGKPDGHFILSKTNPLTAPLALLAGPIISSSNDLSVSVISWNEIHIFDKTPANGGPLMNAYFTIKFLVLANAALWLFAIYFIFRKTGYRTIVPSMFFILSLLLVLYGNFFLLIQQPDGMNVFDYLGYLRD